MKLEMTEIRDNIFQVDVIIVGAGISGLTAAYTLLKYATDVAFLVIEGKDRVGGRTFGKELTGAHSKAVWDLGGQWVGNSQVHVMKLLRELEIDVYPQFTDGKKICQINGQIYSYMSDIPSLPLLSLIDLGLFMRKIEKFRETIPIHDPCQCKNAKEWDNMTVEQALDKYMWTQTAKETIRVASRCMFGAEPSDMSFLYFLMYVKAAGGLEQLISAKQNMGQEFKIQGGAFSVCQKLAVKLDEKRIHKNCIAVKVIQTENHIEVHSNNGVIYKCKRLILALPPNQTGKIEFLPALPMEKLFVLNRMPVGHLTKIIITYQTSFWREKGYSGEFVTDGGEIKTRFYEKGPLNIGFDATSFDGKNPALVTFIGGKQHIAYSKLSKEDRKIAVLNNLASMFGKEALQCLDYFEKNWNEECYTGGCPVCMGTTGVITRIAPGLRHPFGRIHFAGTESATAWCGFLNGGVQAGERAVYEVLYHIKPEVISKELLQDTFYGRQEMCAQNQSSSVWNLVLPAASVLFSTVILLKMFKK